MDIKTLRSEIKVAKETLTRSLKEAENAKGKALADAVAKTKENRDQLMALRTQLEAAEALVDPEPTKNAERWYPARSPRSN